MTSGGPHNEDHNVQVRLKRVVSGGQTGVDRAALDAARAAGIPIGGWCPRGRRAEDGVIAASYPLTETPSEAYEERTAWNVRDSDATLVVAEEEPAGGTKYTLEEAARRGRATLVVPPDVRNVDGVIKWLASERIETLNVAGPRESTEPGIYAKARSFLASLFGAG